MKKRIISALAVSLIVLSACSVNEVKPVVVNGLKNMLDTKTDVINKVVPSGDHEVTVGNEHFTVKADTFNAVKSLVTANNEVEKSMIDLVGGAVTDENIALIAHYAEKYGIKVKDLVNALTKTP